MSFRDIKYHLSELLKLNREYLLKTKRNYYFPKKQDIQFSDDLLKEIYHDYAPVFVLSTGRCGTEYLTRILELSDHFEVHHSPDPELFIASKYAYENLNTEKETVKKIFEASRLELILETYLRGRTFIETNNKITFFAYAISDMFPKAKFIHLVRHPGSFVRSGIDRSWYKNLSKHDLGRIVPKENFMNFEKYTDIQKISWLWNETNYFIEVFKESLENSERIFTIKSEDLFGSETAIRSIFDFLGFEYPNQKKLKKMINKKINVQSGKKFPNYKDWNEEDKKQLAQFCTLADKYSYRLL